MDLNHPIDRCRKNNSNSGISESTMVQQPWLRFSEIAKNAMRQLLLLVVVHRLLTPVQSVNGVIWDKEKADFVPIFSKPIFAAMNQERLSRSRAEETHNFQGRTFRFSYYEIDNVISSDKNGTSITGYIGDAWNVLAEYLNLTLKLDCGSARTLGFSMNGGTFSPGLLEMIRLNQTDIIGRLETVSPRLQAAQFTLPFFNSRYKLFMKPKQHYVTTWMWKLFSRKVWFSVLATYIIFSLCSYIFYVIEADMFGRYMIPSMLDSFFNYHGMMCNQYTDSTAMSKSSKMLEYLISLFAVLINAAFNALVIGHMTQVIVTMKQIQDVQTLIETTEYNIFAVDGSLLHATFASGYSPDHSSRSPKKRVFLVNSQTEVYKMLCSSDLAATFLSEEVYRSGKYPCQLNTVGISKEVFISSGVSWHFENKRSIDVGLLKLYEIGLMNAIQRHWVRWWKEEKRRAPEAIVLEQVHFIHMILIGGLVLSLIILILEQITFYCNK